MAGVRARHGQGAGRAGAVEAAHEGYRDALDTHVRAACVSPPVHEPSALTRMLACHMRLWLCLGRLWDHFFDYGVSLSYPFTNSDKLDYGRRALFCTCDLGSWTPST